MNAREAAKRIREGLAMHFGIQLAHKSENSVEEVVQQAIDEATAELRKRLARKASIKMFPIQSERGAEAHPLLIPWSVAERAYSVYSAQYGRDQSLERLAHRGGFGPTEMDRLLPGWRDECSEIMELRADIERLNQMLRDTGYGQGQIDAYAAQCEELERLKPVIDKLSNPRR